MTRACYVVMLLVSAALIALDVGVIAIGRGTWVVGVSITCACAGLIIFASLLVGGKS